ncbi:leucyl aminopeptidase [Sphingosinicella microcystinivorans]|uniref:leucyl aminopeptidase n=1 Tax=Sphingosinicella microcystinivorans TaxID=335406 RepID=UPI0022F39523|nr:leucyl aminopeptidase [Sphingosinicella microcystinivorans]WBX82713.1 leucyl aminopeptidase [Sphingosinicella microcystinivorans]
MRDVGFAVLLAGLLGTAAAEARPVAFADRVPDGSAAIVLPLAAKDDLAVRAASLDTAARDAVGRALDAAAFDYKANSTLVLRGVGAWQQIVVIGAKGGLTPAGLQDIGGLAARETVSADGPVALLASGLAPGVADAAADLAVGADLGGYSFDRYKTPPQTPRAVGRDAPLTVVGAAGAQRYAAQGRALVEGVTLVRDLISEPSNVKYPEVIVERVREAFKGVAKVRIEALGVPEMEKLGMGAILSVGKGSTRPPRMLIVEYRGGGSEAPLVLAGKGITFDSGGISLKPGAGMWRMRTDMAGAATVVGTVLSLAKSGAPVNVVAVAALAENMPDGGATRPGDVVKAYNGKTIEVTNTDAEGRLVLADAVSYAEARFNPAAIVDIATLTGAVGGALGDDYAGLFSRHDALAAQLTAAGKTAGEPLWQLPLHPAYAETMSSGVADILNSAENGRPGAGLGAHFIGAFVKPETPWAHLDVAYTVWTDKALPTAPKGAVGYGVRLLDAFARNWKPVPRAAGEGGR